MADWYVSSTANASTTTFQTSHAYVLGNIVRPTVSTNHNAYVCSTAGTSSTEPTWPTGNNSTITTGSVGFTNVSGQSTYNWSAAAGDINVIGGTGGTTRFAAGDRVFISSDHVESFTGGISYPATAIGTISTPLKFISVNRAGSVPPVTADIQSGSSFTNTNAITFNGVNYFNGMSFSGQFFFGQCQRLENCVISGQYTWVSPFSNTLRLINTQIKFTGVSQVFGGTTSGIVDWRNTSSILASGSVVPTTFINPDTGLYMTFRGVDLSGIITTLTSTTGGLVTPNQLLLDSCRIAPGVVRLGGTQANHGAVVELVNCYDGTNIINERWVPAGNVTTDRIIILSNGSVDNTGAFSQKIITTTIVDKNVQPMEGFPLHTYNSFTGAVKTATVEIACNVALNNDDVELTVEYEGSASSTIKSIIDTQAFLTTSAVTTSTATWVGGTANWSQSTLPHSDNWCVAWGNGVWVAGPNTANTTFGKSIDDGATWTPATAPTTTFSCKSIVYGSGPGLFVAVSSTNNGQASSSPDGTTWTSRTIATASWTSVAYGSITFVGVSATGTIAATSTDGITWTQRTLPTSASWNSITFGNSIFVAVATGTIAATSSDGITWTQRTLPSSQTWTSVTYGNGVFVAISGPGTAAATSPDGITWAVQTLPASVAWTSITYGNGIFVAVASATTTIATSSNGISWTSGTIPVGDFGNVAYGSTGEFIAVPFFNANIAVVAFQPAITQKLTASFTPLKAGWVRGIVKVGKASAKVWHDGQMTIT